jgi:hypothetical protein
MVRHGPTTTADPITAGSSCSAAACTMSAASTAIAERLRRGVLEKPDFLKRINLCLAVQSPLQKYFWFRTPQITSRAFRIPSRSAQGGLSRRRNPPFICAKNAGYAFGYNPPCAPSSGAHSRDPLVSSEERCVRDTRGIGSRRGDLPVGHFCVESPLQKYFASPVGQIISTNSRHPVPQRGVSRSSRTRGGMRWTRQCQARNVMQGGFSRGSVSDQTAS